MRVGRGKGVLGFGERRDDLGVLGGLGLDETPGRRILAEAIVCPIVVVSCEVFLEDALQMSLIQDDHVIEALASDGSVLAR